MISYYHCIHFCCEDLSLIENYDKAIADTTQSWHCHHRDEIRILPSGMVAVRTHKELIENGRYYNCPANELIFLTPGEHTALHNKYSYRPCSEERRKQISKQLTGKKKSSNATYFISNKRPTSLFGKKFKEHFGITHADNPKLYEREKYYFRKFGKVSWEMNNGC